MAVVGFMGGCSDGDDAHVRSGGESVDRPNDSLGLGRHIRLDGIYWNEYWTKSSHPLVEGHQRELFAREANCRCSRGSWVSNVRS